MKIIRRLFGNIDSVEKKILIEDALKIKLDSGYFNHDLDEKSEEYMRIKDLVYTLNLRDDVIGTAYDKNEINSAKTLVFKGAWATGYPQPEDPIQILKNTYSKSCHECGVHGEQKMPFQINEPKLSNHKIISLNWINDEIFAERNLYESFFKNLGIEMREAVLYKKNVNSKTIVQLIIPKAEFAIDLLGLDFTICPICKEKKYSPTVSGFFPALPNLNFSILKTQEYFGSGHSAFNSIIVSNEIMNEMVKNKLAKQYNFIPTK